MPDGHQTSLHQRIRRHIADMILDERVAEGEVLPSVRGLAVQFGVNPLTVAKAYSEFQDQRVILARPGIGLFLAPGGIAMLRVAERARFLREEWPAVARRIKMLGISPSELHSAAGTTRT